MPAPGKKVRKPDSKDFLLEKGEAVEKNSFWTRRIQDGDVVIVKESNEKAKKQGDQ
jgi:SOS-response transcriptional repressor LexA